RCRFPRVPLTSWFPPWWLSVAVLSINFCRPCAGRRKCATNGPRRPLPSSAPAVAGTACWCRQGLCWEGDSAARVSQQTRRDTRPRSACFSARHCEFRVDQILIDAVEAVSYARPVVLGKHKIVRCGGYACGARRVFKQRQDVLGELARCRSQKSIRAGSNV